MRWSLPSNFSNFAHYKNSALVFADVVVIAGVNDDDDFVVVVLASAAAAAAVLDLAVVESRAAVAGLKLLTVD